MLAVVIDTRCLSFTRLPSQVGRPESGVEWYRVAAGNYSLLFYLQKSEDRHHLQIWTNQISSPFPLSTLEHLYGDLRDFLKHLFLKINILLNKKYPPTTTINSTVSAAYLALLFKRTATRAR